MTDDRSPIQLVLLAQAGDRVALGELFKRVQAPLHTYLARLLSDGHLAEDVLQDVFVIVWRKLRWLREPELFRPWVYRIASREAFRRLRKERFWERLRGESKFDALPGAEPAEPVPHDWLEELPGRLAAVTPASRAVLLLHYLEGLTLDEVVFLAAYLILMDFQDRLHWLILIAAVLTYGVVLVGVVNLGIYVNASTQAILRAILAKESDNPNRA